MARDPDLQKLLDLRHAALTYERCFNEFQKLEDINEAIRTQQELISFVDATFTGELLPTFQEQLAGMLLCRHKHTMSASDLDHLIDLLRQANRGPPAESNQVLIHLSQHTGHKPPDCLIDIEYLSKLAASLNRRNGLTGSSQDIDEAIHCQRQAAQRTPTESAEKCKNEIDLASYLISRYDQLGEEKDISEANATLQETVKHPANSDYLPYYHSVHGNCLRVRFERYGNKADIDGAIKSLRTALQLPLHKSETHPGRLNGLALALKTRYGDSGEEKDIIEAVELYREAVQPPLGTPEPFILNNLGNALTVLFEHYGKREDIDEAIQVEREAIKLSRTFNGISPKWLNSLAFALRNRCWWFGGKEDIEEAISLQRQAIEKTPQGDPNLSTYHGMHGMALSDHFMWYMDKKYLDKSIHHLREAVRLTPANSRDITFKLNNLACSLFTKFHSSEFGEVKDLDECIVLYRRVLANESIPHPWLLASLSNISHALYAQFQLFGESEDLNEAITHHIRSIDLTPPASPIRSLKLCHLGDLLKVRFKMDGLEGTLEEAIQHHRDAVRIAPDNSRVLFAYMDALTQSLSIRFMRFGGDTKDIDEALAYQRKCAKVAQPDSVDQPRSLQLLGNLLLCRSRRFPQYDVSEAIAAYEEAISMDCHNSVPFISLAGALELRYKRDGNKVDVQNAISNLRQASTLGVSPSNQVEVFTSLASLYREYGELDSALQAYTKAIEVLPLVAWIGLTPPLQLRQLKPASQNMICDAVGCAVELSERYPARKQWYLQQAIQLFDQGRTIMWSQASKLQPDLEELRLDPWGQRYADELDRSAQELRQYSFRDSGEPLTELEKQASHRAAENFNSLLSEIRSDPDHPKFCRFLLPSSAARLQTAASDGHVILVNVGRIRCDAIIIRKGQDLESVPLSDPSSIENLVKDFSQQVAAFEAGECSQVDELLHRTWCLYAKPILQYLPSWPSRPKSLPRVWWCMAGLSTFIPVHASLPKPKKFEKSEALGMMDLAISSYIPSLSVLIRARQKQSSAQFQMLVVAQPGGGSEPALQVDDEVKILQRHAGQHQLEVSVGASADVVARSLATCTWAHISCHAFQHPDYPLNSAFLMNNGTHLTLARIAQFSLMHAQFAFLAACQSAKGSAALPNESVHLSTGLQFAGFCSVAGTMWPIMDEDGLVVADEFYGRLFMHAPWPSASHTAEALHETVQQLRHLPAARWAQFIHIGV